MEGGSARFQTQAISRQDPNTKQIVIPPTIYATGSLFSLAFTGWLTRVLQWWCRLICNKGGWVGSAGTILISYSNTFNHRLGNWKCFEMYLLTVPETWKSKIHELWCSVCGGCLLTSSHGGIHGEGERHGGNNPFVMAQPPWHRLDKIYWNHNTDPFGLGEHSVFISGYLTSSSIFFSIEVFTFQ